MTRIILIHAGPTPWDDEDRIVGNQSLPLTESAASAIDQIVTALPHKVSAIYRFKKNEAIEQVARMLVKVSELRPHDSAALDEVHIGLWQGLTRAELKFRFPTIFPQWEDNPLAVNPPDGEPLSDAIERLRGGIRRILKRNWGGNIALPLRPMAMQITIGLLRGEEPPIIAGHLHNLSPIETMEFADDKELYRVIA